MTLFALYFKYVVDPRWSSVSDFVVHSFWHGPSLWSFSDSLWLKWSAWSPLMSWDGAISMSTGLHGMVWVSIQEHNSHATVCHVNHHGLILFGILEGTHCSSVISSLSGLASWTLVVMALLKFLALSASAVLTSDKTLVSITWLRC